MPRPSARLALLAAALAALAACSGDDASVCPGEEVATLVFSGTLTPRDALHPSLDPFPEAPDCAGGIPYPAALAPFTATVSTDPESVTAALCRATERAQQLFGTLADGRLDVATTTDGVVLGDPCPATCVARMTLAVRGSLSVDAGALRFDGAVVERLALREGADCGACLLPCAARYAAVAVPAGAPSPSPSP